MHNLFNRPSVNGLFVMADLGLTCGGCVERSIELIKTAAGLGVDAVKFQMLDAGELLGDRSVEYTYPTLAKGEITENMYEMFLQLQFTDEEWAQIKHQCDLNDIGLIVTCHVESAVARVNKLDLPVNKICTWSLSHYRMIGELAKNGKPLIIDTGTINFEDLTDLKNFYSDAGGGEIIILYDFHTSDLADMNFSAVQNLIGAGFKVGYTPQGRRDWLDYMAVGLGISFIEKRLTLSRDIPENGHWKAHNPDDFKTWMSNIQECHRSLGDGHLEATAQDLEDAKKYYKSAWLRKDVSAGELIDESFFEYKRPGVGVSSKEIHAKLLGKPFPKDYKAGEMFTIKKNDFE
jgi:sialic acid synthase SpsE